MNMVVSIHDVERDNIPPHKIHHLV